MKFAAMMNSMQKRDRGVAIWLFSGCFLIFVMVVLGGITRLTGSGLSITEWNVLMGAFPPMNDTEWTELFNKYQQSPQFHKVNAHMNVDEFKGIFWWEYIHRLTGRLLGVVFIVPFIWFTLRRRFDKSMMRKALFLFALGGLQGLLGWLMVKSGLVDNPYVSHYRLAIHMITAFITFGFTFWFGLEQWNGVIVQRKSFVPRSISSLATVLMIVLMLQIVYGAFVAGLHAGLIYTTFPDMNGQFIPDEIGKLTPFWRNLTENHAGVQFVHRSIAYLVTLLTLLLWWRIRKDPNALQLKPTGNFLLGAIALQFTLGVFTLLFAVPVSLGVLHQMGAFVLFAAMVYVLVEIYSGGER